MEDKYNKQLQQKQQELECKDCPNRDCQSVDDCKEECAIDKNEYSKQKECTIEGQGECKSITEVESIDQKSTTEK